MDNGRPAALIRFESLLDYAALEQLIAEGESEDLFYECKAPTHANVNQEIRATLARAASGFSNTEGGVLIYGVETSKHSQTGSDIMLQITRVPMIKAFAKRIANTLPTLTMPAITQFQTRVIKQEPGDTAGVLIVYIPPSSRPVQSLSDGKFYFRGGDQFVDAPYSTIERLFLATEIPDIRAKIEQHRIIDTASRMHQLSVVLQNESSATGVHVTTLIEVENPDNAELITSSLEDGSEVNDGRKIFISKLNGVLHHQLNTVVGTINIKMKPTKRKLDIGISIYADKMMRKHYHFRCQFTNTSVRVQQIDP